MQHNRIAICCDRSGCIVELLRDDIGMFGEDPIGKPLALYIAPSNMDKLLHMLSVLQNECAVFGWGITMCVDGEESLLHFAGAQREDALLLVASDDWMDVSKLNDELMRSNNEQVNHLRGMIKERTQRRSDSEADLMLQMSAIGNELSKAHRLVSKQERELEHVIESSHQLSGMVAHDLRSPLTAIGSTAELLENDDNRHKDQHELLSGVRQACDRMERLLNETLDWSQLEASRLELHPEPTDLNDLIVEVLRLQSIVAARRSVDVRFEPDPSLPPVVVDPLRLQQVLENILTNAFRASAPGDVVHVSLSRHGAEVHLVVQDEGPGIDPIDAERIFRHFMTVNKTPSFVGHGLGLAIVRRLVELHGGTVGVEQTGEPGTKMIVRIPLRNQDAH